MNLRLKRAHIVFAELFLDVAERSGLEGRIGAREQNSEGYGFVKGLFLLLL